MENALKILGTGRKAHHSPTTRSALTLAISTLIPSQT
jgi:hypothetical protein